MPPKPGKTFVAVSIWFRSLSDRSLFGPRERRCVYDAIQRKLSLLEERAIRPHGPKVENGWSLRGAIHRNSSIRPHFDAVRFRSRRIDYARGDGSRFS